MKKLILSIRLKIFNRFLYLKRKRNNKIIIRKVISKYNLDNPKEQKKLIEQYQLLQKNKRVFGRKARLHIEEKIQFMLLNGLIKLK
jgi:hypothetical protein